MNDQVSTIMIPKTQLRALCERYHVRKLAVFGSILGPGFRPASDIDMLVEFEPEHVPGFFRFYELQEDLSTLFTYPVDLNTAQSLSRHFRQKVLDTAWVIYERAG